jgi:hypothetical protein
MQYFVSKNHNRLNHRLFSPETVVDKICLNPKYGVSLGDRSDSVEVLLDSGAFQDIKKSERLTYQGALNRQLAFEDRTGFQSKFLVSYDRIVDESPTVHGERKKRRVNLTTADSYVQQTIDAAKFLADQRDDLYPRRLVLSNQGVTPDQYIGCLKETLKFAEPTDVIGLGGFCIIGQIPRFTKDYFEVLERALPLLRKKGVRRLHIFGVGVFKTLIRTHVQCWRYGVTPSYDTSSLELNAVYGRAFSPDHQGIGPDGVHLTTVFDRKDKYVMYHPRDWAMLNIEVVNEFWTRLNKLYPIDGDDQSGRRPAIRSA